jgi:hypothetical protein
MTEARDALLEAVKAVIEAAPEDTRHKALAAVKAFEAEHVERKTSLSRFMAHLIAPAAPAESEHKPAASALAKTAARKAAPRRTKAKKKTG